MSCFEIFKGIFYFYLLCYSFLLLKKDLKRQENKNNKKGFYFKNAHLIKRPIDKKKKTPQSEKRPVFVKTLFDNTPIDKTPFLKIPYPQLHIHPFVYLIEETYVYKTGVHFLKIYLSK